jgi:hypothetical protein
LVSNVIIGGVTKVHYGTGRGKFPGMVENSRSEGAQVSPCRFQFPCNSHSMVSLETP